MREGVRGGGGEVNKDTTSLSDYYGWPKKFWCIVFCYFVYSPARKKRKNEKEKCYTGSLPSVMHQHILCDKRYKLGHYESIKGFIREAEKLKGILEAQKLGEGLVTVSNRHWRALTQGGRGKHGGLLHVLDRGER